MDVCVWERETLVCVGLPLVLLHHCFSSLGQETAVESEAEVKVCTQPFEGYSVLPANINQIAWSWAFTELENHIMLAHSHRHRLQHTVSHAGSYVATPMKVDLAIIEQVHGFLGYFHLTEQNSGKFYQLIYVHFQDESLNKQPKTSKQMRSKSIIKMNERLEWHSDRATGIFWASRLATRTCHFLGKLVTPLAQAATSPQSTGWLLCGF